ncbi:MAG TPA: hypothetical protein VMY35_12630, partial [Phycisphaerae bacterium]|nr:hypothetical protein [Phycisphaerae bacterium]
AAAVVNEWESQSQADPTGFHVNVMEWLGTAPAPPVTPGVPRTDPGALGGSVQSLADLKDFADVGYDPVTNKVQGVVLVDSLAADQSGVTIGTVTLVTTTSTVTNAVVTDAASRTASKADVSGLAQTGADADTLETLSDQIDVIVAAGATNLHSETTIIELD